MGTKEFCNREAGCRSRWSGCRNTWDLTAALPLTPRKCLDSGYNLQQSLQQQTVSEVSYFIWKVNVNLAFYFMQLAVFALI